jgi:hypothetical protein
MPQAMMIVTVEIEKINNRHQTILNVYVVGSVDYEAAHSFRLLFVQPADASGGLSQPKNGI